MGRDLVVNLLPLVAFVVVYFVLCSPGKAKKARALIAESVTIAAENLIEVRRLNANMERLIELMEQRLNSAGPR